MFEFLGRLLTRAAEALDRSLIMVPDVDEADAMLTTRHLNAVVVKGVGR